MDSVSHDLCGRCPTGVGILFREKRVLSPRHREGGIHAHGTMFRAAVSRQGGMAARSASRRARMKSIERLYRKLALRRLLARAGDLADLASNPLRTVYPREIGFDPGAAQRVLVLTPHADAETFGAGGTLVRHLERGDEVTVVLFSDNVASIDGEDRSPEEKRALREAEFSSAMDVLGVRDRRLLHRGTGALESPSVQSIVADVLIEKEPHVLYLPSTYDNHEEHRRINRVASRALRAVRPQRLTVRGYEVWSPAPVTALADISRTVTQKRAAIRCYASQLQAIEYEHHILGLNAYRAMTLPRGARFAEGFLELPSDAYAALVSRHLDP